jgi:hypothetical protein
LDDCFVDRTLACCKESSALFSPAAVEEINRWHAVGLKDDERVLVSGRRVAARRKALAMAASSAPMEEQGFYRNGAGKRSVVAAVPPYFTHADQPPARAVVEARISENGDDHRVR